VILSRHKSGPLPKAFKMIPSLPQWARILALTNPTEWTPHSTLAATRIFISNLKPEQARVFLEGVLLERVRTDMLENHDGRKLDVQLYEALKKAIYKPAAFFKGILFPLLQVRRLVLYMTCAIHGKSGWLHTQGSSHCGVRTFQSQRSVTPLGWSTRLLGSDAKLHRYFCALVRTS